jgi:hypothetical protein
LIAARQRNTKLGRNLSRSVVFSFSMSQGITRRPALAGEVSWSPGRSGPSAAHDDYRAIEIEVKVHLADPGIGHDRAQLAAVMGVKQQKAAPASADELAPVAPPRARASS